ncbi:hypothetical protein ROR02_07620 [Pararhodospirillum oryzae]|uniref:Uncharacterized protein n=1 Tax=Pararhodospirillum oryzae TaxID=478448 RepID=A0A512H5C2_9PROT|nr:hypothetical protein ROR02_07620 [Pararhodospirillum oryzae]
MFAPCRMDAKIRFCQTRKVWASIFVSRNRRGGTPSDSREDTGDHAGKGGGNGTPCPDDGHGA